MKTCGFLLLILTCCPVLISAQDNESHKINILEIGAEMPWFELPGVDGHIYTPSDFSDDKLLVVIFTCNHCPTAQAYEQRILELYNDFNSKGVGFTAISPNSNEALSLAECGYSDLDDSFEAMKIRAKDIGLPFPYLYDGETSQTSMKFGPVATPHVFIFDAERQLRYKGRIDDMESPYEQPTSKDARNAITALLNGEVVPLKTTKTFGCSVKWPWKDEWTKKLIRRWENEEVTLKGADTLILDSIIRGNGEDLTLINVWATFCGPCVMEFPDLVDTYRMYSGRGFEFVTLSMDRPGNSERVLEFLSDQNAAVENYIWEGKNSYEAIDIVDPDWQGSLPFTMLLGSDGEIIFRHAGPVDVLELRRVIIRELGRYFADD